MIDKHSFIDGLSVDTSPYYLKQTQFSNAENVRYASSYNGDVGELVSVEGNSNKLCQHISNNKRPSNRCLRG